MWGYTPPIIYIESLPSRQERKKLKKHSIGKRKKCVHKGQVRGSVLLCERCGFVVKEWRTNEIQHKRDKEKV
jgi:hypothetical protein